MYDNYDNGNIFFPGLIIAFFSRMVSRNKQKKENLIKRDEAINQCKETYISYDGSTRLVSTDEKVLWKNDLVTQDRILISVDSGKVIKNLSEEKRKFERKISKAVSEKSNKTVYLFDRDNHFHEKVVGERYKDLSTGEEYVIRRLNAVYYYMSVESGKLIRITDNNFFTGGGVNIDEFNLKQQKLRKPNYYNCCYDVTYVEDDN